MIVKTGMVTMLLAGLGVVPPESPPGPTFVNRVWRVAESSGMTPGQLVVFLSEGTLVFASPHGKPSLGAWRVDAGFLTMVEEGLPYKVDVLASSRDELRIRSHNPGGFVETRFVSADESTPTGPHSEAGVLSGTVAYRERVALPPDAALEVWPTDVSPLILPMAVIAETTVRSEGRQVPLAFELRYDPSRIAPDHDYALRAVIQSGGRPLFETEKPQPVITKGNPTQVDLWLVRVGEKPSPGANALVGSAWRLQDLGGAPVRGGAPPTLEFLENGRVAGHGSCNRFFGTVEVSGEAIRFGSMGSTRMACPQDVMVQEDKYLKALEAAERFKLDGPTLLIHCKGTDRPLRFARRP